MTFEHKFVNASFDYMSAKDQTSVTRPEVNAHGWSAWVTPRTTVGWEGLLRFDHLEPNTNLLGKRDRVIGGVAYWFPMQGNVSTALLLDVDNTEFKDFTPAVPTQRRLAVHMLLNF